MTQPTISAAELSLMLQAYAPRRPDPCRVCGSTDMRPVSMGGGEATVYRCGVTVDAMYNGRDSKDNSEHYRRSEQRITWHGDPRVVDVLLELRDARVKLGEDMTVPAGTVAWPNGHGQHRCYRSLVHRGDDRWDEVLNWDYTHNPAHKHTDIDDED